MPAETSPVSDHPPGHPLGLPWAEVSLTPLSAGDAAAFLLWQNGPRLRDLTMGYR